MRERILELVEDLARRDSSVVFLTGDLGFRVTDSLKEACGPRFFNVGVAESNLVTLASGLGRAGHRPFLYSIIPFATLRCLEQIRNDLCYQKIPARILGMGAGFTYGNQGPTHHALEDLQVMAALPGIIVMNPGNVRELEWGFRELADSQELVYFRIGKDAGSRSATEEAPGRAYRVCGGAKLNLVVSGHLLQEALLAAKMIGDVNVISVPIPHPFPFEELSHRLVRAPVLTLTEAYPGNPLECGVMNVLLQNGHGKGFRAMNVPREFPSRVGDTAYLKNQAGISASHIVEAARLFY